MAGDILAGLPRLDAEIAELKAQMGDGVLVEQLLEEVKARLEKVEEQNGVIIGHLEALMAEDDAEGSEDGGAKDAMREVRGIAPSDRIAARADREG